MQLSVELLESILTNLKPPPQHTLYHIARPWSYAPRCAPLDLNELLSGGWMGPCVMSADLNMDCEKPFSLRRWKCVCNMSSPAVTVRIVCSSCCFATVRYVAWTNGNWRAELRLFVTSLLSLWYCTFRKEVRLSSSWIYYDLIRIQSKLGDSARSSAKNELLSVHKRVQQHWDEHNGCLWKWDI